MMKIKFSAKWTAIAITTLIMGFEPLAAGAVIQSEAAITVPAIANVELADSNPTLIARADRPTRKRNRRKVRKSRSRKPRIQSTSRRPRIRPTSGSPESTAEVERFQNVYQAGFNSVRECITNGDAAACNRLSNSKSALNSSCLQGKRSACTLFEMLSSQEAYQLGSDALLQSVQ
jgi:hypothetical protein